jgi:hypothetical protein
MQFVFRNQQKVLNEWDRRQEPLAFSKGDDDFFFPKSIQNPKCRVTRDSREFDKISGVENGPLETLSTLGEL